MLRLLLSCIFMTNPALNNKMSSNLLLTKRDLHEEKYAVTCFICVNVSDNLICNQYAIDRSCKPGETFCHTLHIMDSIGTSVLVNKKCATNQECQQNKVGCIEIDSQTMCVSCCDQNYCNENVPTNTTNAIYDDKITKMRLITNNLYKEKALKTIIKQTNNKTSQNFFCYYFIVNLLLLLIVC